MSDVNESHPTPDDEPGGLGARLARPSPSSNLQSRVEQSLRNAALLQSNVAQRRSRMPMAYAAIAAVVLFIAGYSIGYTRHGNGRSESEPSGPRFALLLYGPDEGPETAADVEEHRQWAMEVRREGHSISGEKLGASTAELGAPPTPSGENEPLQGFFIVGARDKAEAVAIARSSPHVKHGGRLIVREIDST